MAGRSVWYEVGRAIRGLLSGGSAPQRRPVGRGAGPGVGFDDSPGRFGEGATRDLERAEFPLIRIEYAPDPDGDPDPGEVVWTWVPYVENDGRGKDRPVLIVGRVGADAVVGCYLSTKRHDGFVPIGRGGWDSQGRESYLSPDRLLRITHGGMRRESVQVDREHFAAAARAVVSRHGIRLGLSG